MTEQTPTVVLVHGAFADASSWSGVIRRLQDRGVTALAVANDLRGGAHDGARLASLVRSIDGPVLLVGHSYGGVVITEAASRADNVTGLVYIAAFAIDEGEAIGEVLARYPQNSFGEALVAHTYDDGEVSLSLDPAAYPRVFAADVAQDVTPVLAVSQRPIVAAAFEEKAGPAAWKRLPSHYLVATQDEAIHPEAQRGMAALAGAKTVEVDASHAVAVSRPDVVADVVFTALGK